MLQLDGKITNITIFLTKYLDIMQQYNTVSENGEKHVFKLSVLSDQQSKTENILIFQWYNSKNKSRESSTNQTTAVELMRVSTCRTNTDKIPEIYYNPLLTVQQNASFAKPVIFHICWHWLRGVLIQLSGLFRPCCYIRLWNPPLPDSQTTDSLSAWLHIYWTLVFSQLPSFFNHIYSMNSSRKRNSDAHL